MTDPCTHPIILIHPLPESLTLPKPGNMLFRGAQRTTPSHISKLVQPESHILQACHNHISPVHTGSFSTWYISYIGTGMAEPCRIIIPNIFWVLFWKEKHVSLTLLSFHKIIWQFLWKLLVSAPMCAVKETVLSTNKPGSSIMPGEVNLT
jgi:hypothetical protein